MEKLRNKWENFEQSVKYGTEWAKNYGWIPAPLLFYLAMFLLAPLMLKKSGADECNRNFISDLDLWLFEGNLYSFLAQIQNPIFDLIAAVPYLLHFTLPFLYGAFLHFHKKDNESLSRYIFSFGLTNSIGVLLQYTFPTPPPWLVMGKSPEANFVRVDEMTHIPIFHLIYSNSPLVCGAFPSLHTAWPAVILFNENPWIGKWFCWLHVFLIGSAAMYSTHHYLIDVLAGFALAFLCCQIGTVCIQSFHLKNNNKQKQEQINYKLIEDTVV